jgi:hypothetical protein
MPVTLKVHDLSPRFLKFYELAQGADPDTRWKLWEEHYRFAAVPPTDYGMAMARKMLDECWDRYPEVMDAIRAGFAGFRPEPQPLLAATAKVLEFNEEIEINFVAYVGNLERNAFAASFGGMSTVNFPLESSVQEWAPYSLPHEFTHIFHERLCHSEGGWLRSIGMTMMQEGLAIWASKAVSPGFPDWRYVAMEKPDWPDRCQERERAILGGIRPRIAETSEDALQTFIFGPGPGGLDREVYWAGYRVVGHLLSNGCTLAQLARLTEEQFLPLIDRTLAELTA